VRTSSRTDPAPDRPDLRAALRSWLIDQSQQAHDAADHPDGQPGDPGGYFDKGAAHMADATLTWISEHAAITAPATDAGLREAAETAADYLTDAPYGWAIAARKALVAALAKATPE
jgi:hypothetical protein